MKKLIYFLIISLLAVSCHITKDIYDDVYDRTELNPVIDVDDENGYADYIKKEEKKYTIEPEQNHYSYIQTNDRDSYNFNNSSSFGNNSINFNSYDSDYYCHYHNRFHSHRFDTYFCSDWPNNNFSYYHNPYGYNYGCGHYSNYYGGLYSNHNCGYGNYWGYYGNVDPYSPWSVVYPNAQDSENAANNSNHFYGHRGGTSGGVTSNNTTVYTHTVKSVSTEASTPATGLPFNIIKHDHVAVSQTNVSNQVFNTPEPTFKPQQNISTQQQIQTQTFTPSNHPQVAQPVSTTTVTKEITANKPASNPFSKPMKTSNTSLSKTGYPGSNTNSSNTNANTNTGYQSKYNSSTTTNGSTTQKVNNRPSTATSRRTTPTSNSNNKTTTPSTNRGNTGSTTSGHRGGGGSGSSGSSSSSGSSRR